MAWLYDQDIKVNIEVVDNVVSYAKLSANEQRCRIDAGNPETKSQRTKNVRRDHDYQSLTGCWLGYADATTTKSIGAALPVGRVQ